MKHLKIASIFVLAVFALSFMVSGVYAAEKTSNWRLHVKTVELNETFTVAPSGIYIPEVSFDAKYNKNYLNLVSKEGNIFKFKAIKPGITYVNILLTPWYPPNSKATVVDTYIIIVKNPLESKI